MSPPRTIYRYELPLKDRVTVRMPAFSTVIAAEASRTTDAAIDIWAVVCTHPEVVLVEREYVIVGTGNPLPDDAGAFVATVITHNGRFVWHVFEVAA